MPYFAGMVLVVSLCLSSDSPAQKAASEALAGKWDDVTPERENHGKRTVRPKTSLTITGTAWVAEAESGRIFRQSLFTLGKDNPHRLIDLVTVDGGIFYTTRALYKIEGDILTIKEGALERPRPTDLAPDELDGGAKDWAPVYIYKRRVQ